MNNWYDQRKQELDTTITGMPGMIAGIEFSVCFLFLSGQKSDYRRVAVNRPYPTRVILQTYMKCTIYMFLHK